MPFFTNPRSSQFLQIFKDLNLPAIPTCLRDRTVWAKMAHCRPWVEVFFLSFKRTYSVCIYDIRRPRQSEVRCTQQHCARSYKFLSSFTNDINMRYTYCLQLRHAKRSGRTLGQSRTRWPTIILSAGCNHAMIQKNHPFVAIHTLYRYTFNFFSFLCAGPRCMAKFYVSLENIIMIHKAFRISTS